MKGPATSSDVLLVFCCLSALASAGASLVSDTLTTSENVQSFEAVTLQPPLPGARASFAFGSYPCKDTTCLIVFGGNGDNLALLNDTWITNTDNTWVHLSQEVSPPARTFVSFSSSSASGELVLFGGLGENRSPLNDMWVFSSSATSWTHVSYKSDTDVPSPRFGHAGGMIGQTLYVWGGLTWSSKTDFFEVISDNTLYEYNFATSAWHKVAEASDTATPVARGGTNFCMMQANLVNETFLFVAGGLEYNKTTVSGTVSVYSPRLNKWLSAPDLPHPVAFGGANCVVNSYQPNSAIIYGGTTTRPANFALDFGSTLVAQTLLSPLLTANSTEVIFSPWSVADPGNLWNNVYLSPSERSFFGFLGLTYPNVGNVNVLFGGVDPYSRNFFNSMWITPNFASWTFIESFRPPRIEFGSLLPLNSSMLLFGGKSGYATSQLSVFELSMSPGIYWTPKCEVPVLSAYVNDKKERGGNFVLKVGSEQGGGRCSVCLASLSASHCPVTSRSIGISIVPLEETAPLSVSLLFGGELLDEGRVKYSDHLANLLLTDDGCIDVQRLNLTYTPPARAWHAAGYSHPHMYVFGGTSSSGIPLHDAWVFSTHSYSWSEVTDELEKANGPELSALLSRFATSAYATLQAPGGEYFLYIFATDGNMYSFDYRSTKFAKMDLADPANALLPISAPSPRKKSSFTSYAGHLLFVYSGISATDSMVLDDSYLWGFETMSNSWIRFGQLITQTGSVVGSMLGIIDNKLYLYGGMNSYVFSDNTYSIHLGCPSGYYGDLSSSCSLCPVGTYSSGFASLACSSCTGALTTPGQGATGKEFCTQCKPDACHGHGSCHVDTDSGVHCSCDFWYRLSNDCSQPGMAYLIVVIVGLALVLLLGRMLFSRLRRLARERTVATKQLDAQSAELQAYRRSWEVRWEDLYFTTDLLKSGSFGEVRSAMWLGRLVAVKILRVATLQPETSLFTNRAVDRIFQDFEAEMKLMPTLKHENVAFFFGAGSNAGVPFLVMELLERGSLYDVLHSTLPISAARKIQFALDGARGCAFLHSQTPPLIHRDLKSLNFLVHENMTVKVTDFGSSRLTSQLEAKVGVLVQGNSKGLRSRFKLRNPLHRRTSASEHEGDDEDGDSAPLLDANRTMTHNVGTLLWQAPEMLSGSNHYDTAVDVYSFAIVMWEIMHRLDPYSELQSLWDFADKIQQGVRPKPVEHVDAPHAYVELMQEAWSTEPHRRPTFAEIVSALQGVQEVETQV